LLPLMSAGRILPYLDIPFQHASLPVLRAMKRPAATENTLKRIQHWRSQCPELTIRSTFIVGFPGETDADFELLLDFLQQAQLDRVGCFQYSAVEGADANALPDPVPESLKQERWERFMAAQQKISASRLQDKIGSVQQVLVDESNAQGIVARSQGDAPEIDGVVIMAADSGVSQGDTLRVRVTAADDYDLYAELA